MAAKAKTLILPSDYQRPKPDGRVRARYDAAQTHRHNENHWSNADSLSAAAAHSPDVRQKLRDRARYECANNTYAAGMLATLANDVVGTGPRLRINTGSHAIDSQIEQAWSRWSSSVRLAGKLRTMRMAQARDGEAFAVLTTNLALDHPVKLDVRLYEADQVASPWMLVDADNNADGIVFDDFDNPMAYRLLRRHPGDTTYFRHSMEYETIRAKNMLHLFRRDRPGQVRGVPEITPALPLYAQLRRYTLAVIGAAETAADIAAYLQTQAGPEDPDDVEPLDTIDIEKRMLMTLPKGWQIAQLKAEHPTTTYAMFKREIIAEIARCLNMPYNVAAGDSSGYNYASGRLDHKTYFKSIRVHRADLEQDSLDRTFDRWWEEARLVDGVLPDEMRTAPLPPSRAWAWGGDEHVDPLKEASAQGVRLANHTTTLADEYARQGKDWEEELRQRSTELALMTELGLTPAQPAANNRSPDDDSDQREEEDEDDEQNQS